jgi:uncharacterized protein YuzE
MKKRATNINEHARSILAITRDEYALCSYVQYRQADRRGRAGWCVDTRDEIAEFVGITRRGLYKMILRLVGEGLLYADTKDGALQVSEKWIDTENDGNKVPVRMGTKFPNDGNKVPERWEQSSRENGNKVPDNIEVEYDNKKEIAGVSMTSTRAEIEKILTLNTENESGDIAPGLATGTGPDWGAFPRANTPIELQAELSKMYKAFPEEWRATKDGTQAAFWPDEKIKAVVAGFCEWAISEGWERRTFRQINARLKRWLKDEPLMQRKQPEQQPRLRPVKTA